MTSGRGMRIGPGEQESWTECLTRPLPRQTMRQMAPRRKNCPCSGMTLDKLVQPAALTLLAGGPMHGYRLLQALAQTAVFAEHPPHATGVYRSLIGMEKRGLVASTWETSASGPAKRLFRLTPAGRDCIDQWRGTLEHYRQGISGLLRMMSHPTKGPVGRPSSCGCKPLQRPVRH